MSHLSLSLVGTGHLLLLPLLRCSSVEYSIVYTPQITAQAAARRCCILTRKYTGSMSHDTPHTTHLTPHTSHLTPHTYGSIGGVSAATQRSSPKSGTFQRRHDVSDFSSSKCNQERRVRPRPLLLPLASPLASIWTQAGRQQLRVTCFSPSCLQPRA
jgi:hypothetical protein